MKTKTYTWIVNAGRIRIVTTTNDDGLTGGTVESNLDISDEDSEDTDDRIRGAIDTLESMLLTMACSGFDMDDDRIQNLIEQTLDHIENNLG